MSEPVTGKPLPYDGLTPEIILDAVDGLGYRCDGRLLALNSYENRVYEIGVEEGPPLVAKFYRPGRWSDETILEEHAFSRELAEYELPVVAPIDENGTLQCHEGFRFSLYPKKPGRTPELEDSDVLGWIGRFMGRIHAVGSTKAFAHRPVLDLRTFGRDPFAYIMEGGFLPHYIGTSYATLVEDLLERIERWYKRAGLDPFDTPGIRLHGDCHPGNILWTDGGPHFVDFDDCLTGPAIQDLWMLISGDRETRGEQLGKVLAGYVDFCDFNHAELMLIEPLRALRMIHYCGWLSRRKDDPAFIANFPWFNTERYWEEQILALREQAAVLDEPPIEIKPAY